MKRCSLYWIDYFFLKKGKLSDFNKLVIKTINDRMNMTYELYFKQPMQAIELEFNMINAQNPHMINSLIRYINHPLSRKYSQKTYDKK